MKVVSGYLKSELRRMDQAAFPYYIRKCAHIMFTCFRPVDNEKFFRDLRKELSRLGRVNETINEVLAEKHSKSGYLITDITGFFKGMLQRYQVNATLKGLEDPPEFQPDKNFKLLPGHPDYVKHDYSLLV